jgi:hypothetical protein
MNVILIKKRSKYGEIIEYEFQRESWKDWFLFEVEAEAFYLRDKLLFPRFYRLAYLDHKYAAVYCFVLLLPFVRGLRKLKLWWVSLVKVILKSMNQEIKISELKHVANYRGENFLYAVGSDGNIYFIKHNPKINTVTWQRLSKPQKKDIQQYDGKKD